MSPFTGSYRECISSLAMVTSPSCYFSWGDISSIVLPVLVASDPASSITTVGRYLMCPTLCLSHTPTSQADFCVIVPTLHLNLTLAGSSSRSTKALLQRTYHQNSGIEKNRIQSFPSTPSASLTTWVLHFQHYFGTSSLPATFKFSATSHQLRVLLQG